jgi:ferrous iron transport protein B
MTDAALRIALAGNPNSGKTTLFNALTGSHLQVGNYPGVTVEKRESTLTRDGTTFVFTDLPGTYSLTAYSEDEVVARDFLIKEKPDFIIDVLDSTTLARQLNLATQIVELGIPVIAALNMVEEAESKGIILDEKVLSANFNIPFIKINAKTGRGIDELLGRVRELAGIARTDNTNLVNYGEEVEKQLSALTEEIAKSATSVPPRWLGVKLLEKDANAFSMLINHSEVKTIHEKQNYAITWIEKHFAKSSEIVMAEQRHGFIRGGVKEAEKITAHPDFSVTEAVDKVIMNPVLALPLFVFVLWGIFQLTFTLGAYPQEALELLFSLLSGVCNRAFAGSEILRSLIVDGVIAGVGGVFSFVPLIVILFLFLSILEDLGYMSRAAFATDKFLHSVGLHGQSIFPLMLGFGCSVPAIMASRTLKSKRDRIITVLVTPMMSCGAKLPIHVLVAGAFFGGGAPKMVMLIYASGVAISIICAFILKHTILKGAPTPFVLELPPYRLPTLRGIAYHVWEKTFDYLRRAGGVILTASILVWFFTTFPTYTPAENESEAEAVEMQLSGSFMGRAGRFIQPVFKPLGFNWKMSVATLTGFAAKEVVASTLGVLYRIQEEGEGTGSLESALRADESISPMKAFSFMLFILLIPPCFAALATVKAELGWRWLFFEFAFLFCVGWICAFLVTSVGSLVV